MQELSSSGSSKAAAEGGKTPILALPDPSLFEDAEASFFEFAEEARRARTRERG